MKSLIFLFYCFFYFLPIVIWSYYLRKFYKNDYYKRIILLNGNKKSIKYLGIYLVIFWFFVFLIINLVSLWPIDYLYQYNSWGYKSNSSNIYEIPWQKEFSESDLEFFGYERPPITLVPLNLSSSLNNDNFIDNGFFYNELLDQYFFRPKQLFGSYIRKWNNIYFKYKPFDGISIDNFSI